MKHIVVLGSTGSIGTQTLDVVFRLPERLKIVGMAAHRNVELFAEQIRRFRPRVASIGTEEDARRLAELLGDIGCLRTVEAVGHRLRQQATEVTNVPLYKGDHRGYLGSDHPQPPSYQGGELADELRQQATEATTAIMWGAEGLNLLATMPEAETVVVSVAGTVGLGPTLAAISAGKDIALASKEVLVAAGSLVDRLVEEKGVRLLPIDSEHSAVFQCMQGEDKTKVRRIMLTASGGALKDWPVEKLANATVEDALAHPNWSMGRKITVDSATLMNKVLEIIEAKWLFGVNSSQIEVVIHPQSIVHSMVEFEDGSVMAQLGIPDMRLPIQYALLYPERVATDLPRLDIVKQGTLTFDQPDLRRYPGLSLAYKALEQGGTMPAVLNAANEAAVGLFLEKKIGFLDIVRTVQKVMDSHTPVQNPDLDQILEADSWAREVAASIREDSIG